MTPVIYDGDNTDLNDKHIKHPTAGRDGSFVSTGVFNLKVPGSNPGRPGYLSSWLCVVVHIQSSKLIVECTMLPMVLCTIKNP